MILSVCPTCAEKMMWAYILIETGAPPRIAQCPQCIVPNVTALTQYEMTPRNRPRRRAPHGPARKDTRARYKEPFRGESGEDW